MQRSDIKKEHFYQSLDLVVNSNKSDKLIVLGDFNSHVGCNSELGPDVFGKHGTGKMKTAQWPWIVVSRISALSESF